MIRVVAKFHLKESCIDEAREIAKELIELTRAENGCVHYDLVQSTKDENVLVILEAWENQQVLDTHSASAHFAQFVPQLAVLCRTPPVVESFQQLI